MATLLQVLPPLWTTEEMRHQKHNRISLIVLALFLTLFIVVAILSYQGIIPSWTMQVLQFIGPISGCSGQLFRRNTPSVFQCGMIRLMAMRPHVALVPFLDPSKKTEMRVHFTRLLPLWCEQDHASLTLPQQKILRGAIKEVVQGGNVLTRPLGGRAVCAITLDDADFALAMLGTLRHRASGERRAVRLRLPAPITANHPCNEIHQVIPLLFAGKGG